MAEVATTKLFENEKVIVWEMLLEPGDSTGLHTHKHSYVIHVLEGSTPQGTDANDENPEKIEFKAGETHWVAVDGKDMVIAGVPVSTTHAARNIGDQRFREILLELK